MERKRWETAIRCLEIALHPHTGDDEVIAAVNGFRRTAEGMPLREICRALAAGNGGEPIDRLGRENRELRRRLDAAAAIRAVMLGRLAEAERRVRELAEELRAAERRAGDEAQAVAELRAAYREILPARRRAAEREAPPAAAPQFRQVLAAERDPGRDGGGDAPSRAPPPRTPWTA